MIATPTKCETDLQNPLDKNEVENTKRAIQAHFPLGEFVRANTKEVGTDPTFRVFNKRFQQYLGEKKISESEQRPLP